MNIKRFFIFGEAKESKRTIGISIHNMYSDMTTAFLYFPTHDLFINHLKHQGSEPDMYQQSLTWHGFDTISIKHWTRFEPTIRETSTKY